MIDEEGTYREVDWWEHDGGDKPFCAMVQGEQVRAVDLRGLQELIDGELDRSRAVNRNAVLAAVGFDLQDIVPEAILLSSGNEAPRYVDILRMYSPNSVYKYPASKVLTVENRDGVNEIAMRGTSEYNEASVGEPKVGSLVKISKNIGCNRSFTMVAEITKPPNNILREDISFQIKDEVGCLADFTLTHTGDMAKNNWDLFHRQVYRDEYKGGSKEELGVSRVISDAMYIFLQNQANKVNKNVVCEIELSQPQVATWALKEGFQPKDGEQNMKWKQMQKGTNLVMKGEGHVFPNTIPEGFGWDKLDYREAGFMIIFTKTFYPEE